MRYENFSQAVIEQLGYYVYMLIDPETDEVFYVGKGTGNRIFAHLNEAVSEITENAKLERIRAIHAKRQAVKHVIHRHGLTEKEAFEVEAALIDLLGLPDLTNLVSGYHSRDRGPMTIAEVIAAYDAPLIEIKEPAILATINLYYHRKMTADELYEYTRGNWRVGSRRENAKYVFAVFHGIVRQVYEVERWYPTQARSIVSKTQMRWRFDGFVAKEMQHYIGGSVKNYITQGAQNPIKYVNC